MNPIEQWANSRKIEAVQRQTSDPEQGLKNYYQWYLEVATEFLGTDHPHVLEWTEFIKKESSQTVRQWVKATTKLLKDFIDDRDEFYPYRWIYRNGNEIGLTSSFDIGASLQRLINYDSYLFRILATSSLASQAENFPTVNNEVITLPYQIIGGGSGEGQIAIDSENLSYFNVDITRPLKAHRLSTGQVCIFLRPLVLYQDWLVEDNGPQTLIEIISERDSLSSQTKTILQSQTEFLISYDNQFFIIGQEEGIKLVIGSAGRSWKDLTSQKPWPLVDCVYYQIEPNLEHEGTHLKDRLEAGDQVSLVLTEARAFDRQFGVLLKNRRSTKGIERTLRPYIAVICGKDINSATHIEECYLEEAEDLFHQLSPAAQTRLSRALGM